MTEKNVGTPLKKSVKLEVVEAESGKPGFGWEMSTETKEALEEIEDNVRNALQRSGTLIVGTPS